MTKFTIHSLILDMDGVLWKGMQPIGDLQAIFEEISRRNLKVVMATNNATTTTQQYVDKLSKFHVDINPDQIITSGVATGAYLNKMYPKGGNIFILGEEGLMDSIEQFGFTAADHDVQAVVVGMDRKLTFEKLSRAAQLIRAGAEFIATNPDNTFPTPEGLIPGAGAILAAVEAASGKKALVIGKPQVEMYRLALEYLRTPPKQTLVVGDRIETDIAGGQALGCRTALVLSGVTDGSSATNWKPAPDIITRDLESLLDLL
ncbi:MAG: HAD-IIA family hydrolase [Anaerolineales bacterium]|nr:HAD-IIA family hydrolase [Anaerolineales bacterium]